ncbi:unnamed protein product, partial [Iphiclides podalirius]
MRRRSILCETSARIARRYRPGANEPNKTSEKFLMDAIRYLGSAARLHNRNPSVAKSDINIYKGLDVVTAKASSQERQLVPHHLLDILEPHQMFTVVDFRNRALKIIENLTEKGKIPIVVGGTNYYIESIVYKILVEDIDDSDTLLWDKSMKKRVHQDAGLEEELRAKKLTTEDSKESFLETSDPKEARSVAVDKDKLREDIENETRFTNEEIHAKLKSIDPVMASRLHPNNRRKVLR